MKKENFTESKILSIIKQYDGGRSMAYLATGLQQI